LDNVDWFHHFRHPDASPDKLVIRKVNTNKRDDVERCWPVRRGRHPTPT